MPNVCAFFPDVSTPFIPTKLCGIHFILYINTLWWLRQTDWNLLLAFSKSLIHDVQLNLNLVTFCQSLWLTQKYWFADIFQSSSYFVLHSECFQLGLPILLPLKKQKDNLTCQAALFFSNDIDEWRGHLDNGLRLKIWKYCHFNRNIKHFPRNEDTKLLPCAMACI